MFLRKKLEEVNDHQTMKDKMAELNVDPLTLFRIAHVNQFGTDPEMTQTYLNWKQHAIIPNFVLNFLYGL